MHTLRLGVTTKRHSQLRPHCAAKHGALSRRAGCHAYARVSMATQAWRWHKKQDPQYSVMKTCPFWWLKCLCGGLDRVPRRVDARSLVSSEPSVQVTGALRLQDDLTEPWKPTASSAPPILGAHPVKKRILWATVHPAHPPSPSRHVYGIENSPGAPIRESTYFSCDVWVLDCPIHRTRPRWALAAAYAQKLWGGTVCGESHGYEWGTAPGMTPQAVPLPSMEYRGPAPQPMWATVAVNPSPADRGPFLCFFDSITVAVRVY